jgi:hypothetical protein
MLNRIAAWFRPKDAGDARVKFLASILESGSPDMIINTTREMICGLDPNGCVMAMVGYKNMRHIYLLVSKKLRKQQLDSGVTNDLAPDTIEGYARFLSDTPIPNEPTRWRLMWESLEIPPRHDMPICN